MKLEGRKSLEVPARPSRTPQFPLLERVLHREICIIKITNTGESDTFGSDYY